MAQSERSTTPDFYVSDEHGGTGTTGASARSVPGMDEVVRLALVPVADTPTKDVSIGNEATGTLPASHQAWNGSGASRILDFPLPPALPRRATLHALQEWEGHVVEMDDKAFVAHLVDLTAGAAYAEEEATIPLVEVSDDDAARMRIGSIFRWVIGYERSPAGTKKRVSQIVFRDLPRMTKADFEEGRAWARNIVQSLDL